MQSARDQCHFDSSFERVQRLIRNPLARSINGTTSENLPCAILRKRCLIRKCSPVSHSQDASASFGTERVQMLADGIFAIAMTLLVLDLKDQPSVDGDIWNQLQLLAPKLLPTQSAF
jgi:hypothetical protein